MGGNASVTRILCYGDSNTYGSRPDIHRRYPADKVWTGILQVKLGDQYRILEDGLGGRTTDISDAGSFERNGEAYLQAYLETHEPADIALIMLGTNDLKTAFHRDAHDVATSIQKLIRLVRAKSSATKIIIVSPIYINPIAAKITFGSWGKAAVAESRQLAPALQTVADEMECYFVDASRVAHAGIDGVHLDVASHAALAELLITQIHAIGKN